MTSPAAFISLFKGRRVIVIGDAILDVYARGTVQKLCREAPAPVVNLKERTFSCGGAANTAVNVAALGGDVTFLAVLGEDDDGNRLVERLVHERVGVDGIVRTSRRRTLTKTRICADSSILARIDEGDTQEIDQRAASDIVAALHRRLRQCDVIILSDYGYGMFAPTLLEALRKVCAGGAPPIIVDAKRPERFRALAPAAVKPNYEEAVRLLGLVPLARGERVEQLLAHGNELLERTGAGFVAATMDADGTVLFERGNRPYLVSCVPQADRQTIGAGDSFVAALALSIAAGAPATTATRLAAAAAAVVIGKDGTGICSNDELRAHFRGHSKQVVDMASLSRLLDEMRRQNQRIVFTNGCFDILHRGHVEFLRHARSLGDVLIVALNSDASIRRLKGEGRPVNTLEDRMEVLAGLQTVDLLISFDSETPTELLGAVRPDVFAKGGTYSVDSLPEVALVRELGGEVEIVPFRSPLTTSRLIEKIQHPVIRHGGTGEQRPFTL